MSEPVTGEIIDGSGVTDQGLDLAKGKASPFKSIIEKIEGKVQDGTFQRGDYPIAPNVMVRLFAAALVTDMSKPTTGPSKRQFLERTTPASLYGAFQNALLLGLNPTGFNNSAWLIRFGEETKLMPGYNGLIQLAMRHPWVSHIDADAVLDVSRSEGQDPIRDRFSVRRGSFPEVVHEYDLRIEDRGNPEHVTHVYSVVHFRDPTIRPMCRVMTKAEVEKVRRSSKMPNDGPWSWHWVAQALKTVVRRGVKMLPLTPEAAYAASLSDQDYELETERRPRATTARPTPKPATDANEALAKMVQEKQHGGGPEVGLGNPSPEEVAEGEGAGSGVPPE